MLTTFSTSLAVEPVPVRPLIAAAAAAAAAALLLGGAKRREGKGFSRLWMRVWVRGCVQGVWESGVGVLFGHHFGQFWVWVWLWAHLFLLNLL